MQDKTRNASRPATHKDHKADDESEMILTAQELSKVRHQEIHRKLNVVKEFQRSGVRVKVQRNFEVPIVQIATSSLSNKNSKADRLKWAIYSKNRMKQRRDKIKQGKLESLRQDVESDIPKSKSTADLNEQLRAIQAVDRGRTASARETLRTKSTFLQTMPERKS